MESERPPESPLSDELAEEIAVLEREIAELRSAEDDHGAAVSALAAEIEARRTDLEALEGRFALTRNARALHEQRLDERRARLKVAVAEDALRVFQEAMAARDTVAREVATAAETLRDRLAALESAREVAHEAYATAAVRAAEVSKRLDPGMAAEIDGVPEVMRDAWDRLLATVREHIDTQFEADLVDAAARSPLRHAIDDLPAHLRELAKKRRRALEKERKERDRESRFSMSD